MHKQKHSPRRIAAKPTGAGFDGAVELARTVAGAAERIQVEALTLWGRRASAYADLPHQFVSCQSPQDLIDMQVSFIATMQRDYANYATGVLRNGWGAGPAEVDLRADASEKVMEQEQRAA
jgi:hypothetical protein